MSTPLPVAILGGGPAGLACALLLARGGRSSVVVDAQEIGRAAADRRLLALSRGSWQLLAPLLPRLPERAPITDVHVSSIGEFGGTHIGAGDHGGDALGATVFYGDLVTALEAASAGVATITSQRPRKVTGLQQSPDRVRVVCEDGSTFDACLAINAEGWAGFGAQEAPASRDHDVPVALVGDVGVTGCAPGAAFERFTREGPLALLPRPGQGGTLRSLVWCMAEDAAERRLRLAPAQLLADLQQAAGRRTATIVSVGTLRAHRLNERVRADVQAHRCIAVGNAAQTLHPVAGQGFNLALRDCVTLIDCLLVHRDDVPAALADYTRRRRVDRNTIAQLTHWLPRVFATRFAPVALARSLGLTALDLVPPLRNELAFLLMFGVR